MKVTCLLTLKEEIDFLQKDKRELYRVTASIHTLELRSQEKIFDEEIIIDEEIKNCVKVTHKTKANGITESKIVVNPNKLNGDQFSFTGFIAVMQQILMMIELKKWNFSRADLRFDNYDDEHYEAFSKLNRYIISLIAAAFDVKNVFQTFHLFTQKQLSVAAKNRDFQVENYDRKAKSKVTGNITESAKARFEIRTMFNAWKEIYRNAEAGADQFELLQQEFLNNWLDRLRKALDRTVMLEVQNRYNKALSDIYLSNKSNYRTLTDFVLAYQHCIYTRSQLIDLVDRCGSKNSIEYAKKIKNRYKIEFFSKADIRYAITEIQRAMKEFFSVDDE
jgi:hypothetical protein